MYSTYDPGNGRRRQYLPGCLTWEEHVARQADAQAALEEERAAAAAAAAAEQAAADARQDKEDEHEYLRQWAQYETERDEGAAVAALTSSDAHALCSRHQRMQDEAEYLQLRAEHEADRHRVVEAAIEASRLPSLSLPDILARHARPSMQAAKLAPLLAPRLSCHAVAIRAACLIQRAWLWHVRSCYGDAGPPEAMDATGSSAPITPSGTWVPDTCMRLVRGLDFIFVPPPFRFLLRLTGRAGPDLARCDAVCLELVPD